MFPFPSMKNVASNSSNTMPGQRTIIDLGYVPQGSVTAAYDHIRPAPLFGGRMTETRLKEVGRITKGAIEQLHKYVSLLSKFERKADDYVKILSRLVQF